MKFVAKKKGDRIVFDEGNLNAYRQYVETLQDGGTVEITVLPYPDWDIQGYHNYFHGIVLPFLVDQFREHGSPHGKEDIKLWAKLQFGATESGRLANVPISMSQYTKHDYRELLDKLNEWCMSNLSTTLPETGDNNA